MEKGDIYESLIGLRTEDGRFYYIVLNQNGELVGEGNHEGKFTLRYDIKTKRPHSLTYLVAVEVRVPPEKRWHKLDYLLLKKEFAVDRALHERIEKWAEFLGSMAVLRANLMKAGLKDPFALINKKRKDGKKK